MKKSGAASKVTKQTIILFISNIALLGIGLLLKNIQTELLAPEQYGLYAFFTSIVSFLVLFFRFGYFSSLQVILAENNNKEKERELIGVGFVIALIIGILFSVTLWLLAFIIDDIFSITIKNILQLFAPLCFLFVFKQYIPAVTTGTNKVSRMPVSELASRILFLILLIIIPLFYDLSLKEIIFFNIISIFISIIYIYISFNPKFTNFSSNLKTVKEKNKSFGFQLYLGQAAQQSTHKFDEIFITYFVNPTQLGYYTLAKFIAMPMVMMSQAITTSLYKFFARSPKVPNKVFLYNFIWLIACILFLYLFDEFLVDLIFGKAYMETSRYIVPIAIAFLFQGLYQPFSFLSAKSKGKEIRNIALIETIVNISGNLILIPMYGVMGAIYATILSKAIHFVGLFFYYRKYLDSKTEKEFTPLSDND